MASPFLDQSSSSLAMEEGYSDEPSSYARVSLDKREQDTLSESDAGTTPYHSLLGKGKQYKSFFHRQFKKVQRRFTKGAFTWIVMISFLLISHGAFFSLGSKFRRNLDRTCLEHTSSYSPVLKEISSDYTLTKFNGTLGFKSEYSGDPSPEVDAAWAKWAYVKYASIPEDEFMKLPGADPEASRLTPEYGGGYIGFLEISHQLHCLNLLRKGIHKDYYMQPENVPEEFTDHPWTVKLHLTHCIEILRQNIMCNADVGIITHQWIVQSPDPFANFNNYHMCRDLSSVENWIHSHEIPTTPDKSDLPIPLGSKIYPTPP